MIKLATTLIACCLLLVGYAQEASQLTKREGNYFFEYKVEKGKTFYGLQRQFDVKKEDLLKHNPELEEGLKKGQTIYIPVAEKYQHLLPKNETNNTASETPLTKHTVQKGETLYGISRQYGISVDELKKWNPDTENGLKEGQQLNVPAKGDIKELVEDPDSNPIHELGKDHTVKHVLQKGETLYSLSKRYMVSIDDIKQSNDGFPNGFKTGDMVIIPVREEVAEILDKTGKEKQDSLREAIVLKDRYKVVVLVPFQFDKNAAKVAKRRNGEPKELYRPTKIGMDFYSGIMLAVDSLSKAGMSVNLSYFDTRKDTGTVSKILAKPELEDADLIIGPFHSYNVKKVADFALENNIHMVVPVPTSNKVLFQNPYVSRAVTSTTTQIKGISQYIAQNYPDANVILVDSKKSKDKYLIDVAKKSLTEDLTAALGKPTEPKMSFVHNYEAKHLRSIVSKERVNIIVAPSKDQGFATNFMTKLNGVKNSWDKYQADIKVFGLSDWEYFNSIDELYKKKLNFHYVSNQFVNYDSSTTWSFLQKFREHNGYDPNSFGFMGFDLAFHYIGALNNFGTGFPERVGLIRGEGVHTKFELEQVQEGSGFENKSIYIIRYDGYKLVRED